MTHHFGENTILYVDLPGLARGLLFCAVIGWAFFAHYSLIGEIKKRGGEVRWYLYGQALFIEIAYLKSGDFRTKKLDFLAYSSIVCFVAPFLTLILRSLFDD